MTETSNRLSIFAFSSHSSVRLYASTNRPRDSNIARCDLLYTSCSFAGAQSRIALELLYSVMDSVVHDRFFDFSGNCSLSDFFLAKYPLGLILYLDK